MNRIFAAAIFTLATSALSFAGCNQPADTEPVAADEPEEAVSPFVGTWVADMTTFQMAALDAMPDEQRQQVLAMLATGAMQLTNNADGTYTSVNRDPGDGDAYTVNGTWEALGRQDGMMTVRTVEVTDTRGPQEVETEPEDMHIEVIDRDTIVVHLEDESGGSASVQLNRL